MKNKKIIFYMFVVVWFFVWGRVFLKQIPKKISYYKFALTQTPNELKERHAIYDEASQDFYNLLQIVDDILPTESKIQLILPDKPMHRHYFLREKGRYYLYPRNFGNNEVNAENIFVYGVENYVIPEGYQMCKKFSVDKYLLTLSNCLN